MLSILRSKINVIKIPAMNYFNAENIIDQHHHNTGIEFADCEVCATICHIFFFLDFDDNQRMMHDYLHYLLADLLIEEKIPFIMKHDLADMPDFRALLNNQTPDLIIKSNGTTRPKPLFVDVFVGKSDKEMSKKKKKYSSMSVCFDFSGLTIGNYNSELDKILTQKNIDYFHKQVTNFRAEHAIWMSGLQQGERNNLSILTLPESSPEFICAVNDFKSALERKATILANNDSV